MSRPAARALLVSCMLGGIGLYGPVDAGAASRATGLGDAAIAIPDPALMGRDNPAVLGIMDGRGLRLSLFDVGVAVGNSAYGLGDYARFNGATLTEEDEDEILSRVGSSGWVFSGGASGYGPGLATGPVAFQVRGVGTGSGFLPRDVLELILDGNVIGETVELGDAGGGGWAGVEGSAAYGHSLGSLIAGGETTIGVRGRYVHGLYHAEIVRAEGRIVTEVDTLYGGGLLDLRSARGGSGYAVDVGALHHRGSWNVGCRIIGLAGTMTWNTQAELRRYEVEGGTIDPLDDDSLDVVSSRDTTLAVGSYSAPLPTRIGVGVAHERGSWLLAADLEHTLRGRMAGEDRLRISLGVERLLLGRHLRPRLGATVGGLGGPSVAGGLSVVVGPWRLDLDAGSYATWNPTSPKGLKLAAGSAFIFG